MKIMPYVPLRRGESRVEQTRSRTEVSFHETLQTRLTTKGNAVDPSTATRQANAMSAEEKKKLIAYYQELLQQLLLLAATEPNMPGVQERIQEVRDELDALMGGGAGEALIGS